MRPSALGPKPAPRRSVPCKGVSRTREASAAPHRTSHNAFECRSLRIDVPAPRTHSTPRAPRNTLRRPTASHVLSRPKALCPFGTDSEPLGDSSHRGPSRAASTRSLDTLPPRAHGYAATRGLQASQRLALLLLAHPRVYDRRHVQQLTHRASVLSRESSPGERRSLWHVARCHPPASVAHRLGLPTTRSSWPDDSLARAHRSGPFA